MKLISSQLSRKEMQKIVLKSTLNSVHLCQYEQKSIHHVKYGGREATASGCGSEVEEEEGAKESRSEITAIL